MPYLTPKAIQQARELAATWIENEYSTGDATTDRTYCPEHRPDSSKTKMREVSSHV